MTATNPLGTKPFSTTAYRYGEKRWYWRGEYGGFRPLYRIKVCPWIPHDGGPCPVEPHVRVRVRERDGFISSRDGRQASLYSDRSWQHRSAGVWGHIIAYQIIED